MTLFSVIVIYIFCFLSILWVGKNKWQNVNRRPYHEHIFMKQTFLGNCSSAPSKSLCHVSMPMTTRLSYLLVIWFKESDSSLKSMFVIIMWKPICKTILHFLLNNIIPFCFHNLFYIYNFTSIILIMIFL